MAPAVSTMHCNHKLPLAPFLLQTRAETRYVFGVRQLANVLRSARGGQSVRQPSASAVIYHMPAQLRGASQRGDSDPQASAGIDSSPLRPRPRPQTAQFRVTTCLDWERAAAGSKAVRTASVCACAMCSFIPSICAHVCMCSAHFVRAR